MSGAEEIQAIAEELAAVKYNRDYEELTDEQQSAIYEQAVQVWRESDE